MISDSLQHVYDRIRTNSLDAVALPFEILELHFPEGPHNPLERQVDIVVVTPESTSYRITWKRSRSQILVQPSNTWTPTEIQVVT